MSHSGIKGNVDIFSGSENGKKHVYIHGDPEGLKSFAGLLISIADVDQSEFFIDVSEHVHLTPDINISKSSDTTIVGRLDSPEKGMFPKRYIKKSKRKCWDVS